MRRGIGALLLLVFIVSLSGCGDSQRSIALEGFVSVKEAEQYFRIHYDLSRLHCRGHGPISRSLWIAAAEEGEAPKEPLYHFIACQPGIYLDSKQAREDGLFPEEELTYGFSVSP